VECERLFRFRGGLYAFVGIELRSYAAHARPISPKWDTLAMSTVAFRRSAAPIERYLADIRAGFTAAGFAAAGFGVPDASLEVLVS
jgi:hypothetical protein